MSFPERLYSACEHPNYCQTYLFNFNTVRKLIMKEFIKIFTIKYLQHMQIYPLLACLTI